MGALTDIPGLGGYIQQQQLNEKRPMLELQEAGALTTLLKHVNEAQKEHAYRTELAQAKTPEEQAAVAARYGGPEGILKHADRLATVAANKEATLARLKQTADQFEANLAIKDRMATTAEDRAAVAAERTRFRSAIDAAALRMTGERLSYDTGATVAVPAVPGASPPQPAGQKTWTQPTSQQVPPQDRAAFDAVLANAKAGIQSAEYGVGGAAPVPVGGPVAAPAAAPVSAPMPDAGNLDARDLQARAALPAPVAAVAPAVAQAVAEPAPAAPAVPAMPPEIARLPKKAQDAWTLAQAKKGDSAGKASESVVTAIKEGRMQMPTGFALRSPYWQDVVERVAAQDPNFDASRYGARAAARRTFASGPEARNVTALNTVIGHLGTLDEMATALENKDLRLYNAVANRIATELGDPRIQNFDTAKQAVAEETMRVFRGVGASEVEARMWGERISASGSPAQLRGVISTLGKLLDSRVEAIGQQYERSVNGQGNPATVDPKNRDALDRLKKNGGGASVPDFPSEEAAAAAGLPNGTKIKIRGVAGTWN